MNFFEINLQDSALNLELRNGIYLFDSDARELEARRKIEFENKRRQEVEKKGGIISAGCHNAFFPSDKYCVYCGSKGVWAEDEDGCEYTQSHYCPTCESVYGLDDSFLCSDMQELIQAKTAKTGGQNAATEDNGRH